MTEPKDEEGSVAVESLPINVEPARSDGDDDDPESEGEEEAVGDEPEKPLDDDLDRRNPQYIPKGGAFYEHDNRTSVEEGVEEESKEADKKKVWKESKTSERWLHDCYVEDEQTPKTSQDIIDIYGYDIRVEENAPRARRRRKYGRGPDKYDRKWDDEEAYTATKKVGRGRGRRRPGAEDFPPLPIHEGDSEERGGAGRGLHTSPPTAWRNPQADQRNDHPRHDHPRREQPRNDYERRGPPQHRHAIDDRNNMHSKARMEDHIKPFRTDSGMRKAQEGAKPTVALPKEVQELSQSLSKMSVQQKQKPRELQPKEQISPEAANNKQPVLDNPANRQNPKRYSKIRKGFTGYYAPEEIELDPRDVKQAIELRQQQQASQILSSNSHLTQQQQQELIAQGVLPRYPDAYNGNPTYIQTRTLITPMTQPGLSPQGLPAQTLSPQLAGIEMGQANFVPPPMFIDIDPHFAAQGEVLPFQGYPAYPQNQNTELYQTPGGITYYSPEVQTGSAQARALPTRRPKAAIPIVPPPETQ